MEITSCREQHPCIDTNQMTQDVLLIEIEDLLFHSSNFQQIITWYTYYQNQFLCCKMSLNGCFMINNFVPMGNDSLYDHLCCQFTSTVQQLEFVSLFWLLNKDEKPLKNGNNRLALQQPQQNQKYEIQCTMYIQHKDQHRQHRA